MKRLITPFFLIVMVILIFCAGFGAGLHVGYEAGQLESLPTQSEVQEILGLPIDGVVGKTTREAWDTFACDRFAMPHMEAFQKEVDRVYGFDVKPLKEMSD